MEYGIKTIGKNVFCANCGRLVSPNGEYEENFCFVCGTPLKMAAIEMKEQEIKEIEQNLIARLRVKKH